MLNTLEYKNFGDKAILIAWEEKISPEIINEINVFKGAIVKNKEYQITDFIIGYNSLVLKYNEIINFQAEIQELKVIYNELNIKNSIAKHLWTIPVCYDLEYGFDLSNMSKELGVSVEEIIALHSSARYTVYFVGFLPGFLYLGGLDPTLELNRKSTPLLKVPKGSVAIRGKQTGVYPQESAGGWHIIGKTPINFFNLENDLPCFAKSGDQLKFEPVNKQEFQKIEIEISLGEYELSKTEIHD